VSLSSNVQRARLFFLSREREREGERAKTGKKRDGWMGGRRGEGKGGVKVLSSRGWVTRKTRGECGFMKLMK
jgi:hypothetical protein